MERGRMLRSFQTKKKLMTPKTEEGIKMAKIFKEIRVIPAEARALIRKRLQRLTNEEILASRKKLAESEARVKVGAGRKGKGPNLAGRP